MESSSSRFRIGVIGAGAIVRLTRVPMVSAMDDATVSAVYDVDRARAEQIAELAGGARVHQSIRELVSDDEVDGVIVANPNRFHAETVVAAAQAGKHVFCEKPIATSLRDARSMVQVCEQHGVVFQIGFNQRWWNPVQFAKRLIDAGIVGRPEGFRSVYSEAYNVYPAATRYRYDLSLSGGACINDLAVHRIDLARHLIGDIAEVCAIVEHRVIPDVVDDSVWLLVRFANGASGVISSDRFSPMVSNATDIYGTHGTIHLSTETINPFQSVPLAVSSSLPPEKLPIELLEHNWPEAWWESFKSGWISIKPPRNSPYRDELSGFIDAARAGSRPMVTGEDGVAALEVVLAAYKSQREHAWVALPLGDDDIEPPSYS